MAVRYRKLWKILIDKDIEKKERSIMAGISPATITKTGKNGYVATEALTKNCTVLGCGLDDVLEVVLGCTEKGGR